jgi:hypothetical protein
MPPPQERLANALDALHKLQARKRTAIRSDNLSRIQRELLLKQGFLREVMKGWYIATFPETSHGESSTWYSSYWNFCTNYLDDRFGEQWSLSPELSLALQTGNRAVPKQLLVRTPKGNNKPTSLPLGTSLFDVRATLPTAADAITQDGLRIFSIQSALIASGPAVFETNAIDARAALATISDASELLDKLLEGGHSVIAGRLAGALRNIGRGRVADDILKAMRSAGYAVREADPFTDKQLMLLPQRERSPYAGRIRLMWEQMREPVLARFPQAPGS